MKKVVIFDATNLMFRSYFASLASGFTNSNGDPTGAIFFSLRTINKIKQKYGVDKFIFAFDNASSKEVRKEMNEDYKANRQHGEDMLPLFWQMDKFKEILIARGYDVFSEPRLEADDVCGVLATNLQNDFDHVYLFSNDRDFYFLLSNNVSILKFSSGEIGEYTITDFYGDYGVINKEQFLDLKAICGDGSDNIQGIFKLGVKGALKIVQQENSIQQWFKNSEGWWLLPKWLREEVEKQSEKFWHNTKLGEDYSNKTIEQFLEDNKKILRIVTEFEDEKFFPTNLFRGKSDFDKVNQILKGELQINAVSI